MNILPCPFCGFDDVCFDEIDVGIVAVCCDNCGTIGPHERDGSQDSTEAANKWNAIGVAA